MLAKNINILVNFNLAQESASVNEIIDKVNKTLKTTTTDIIANIIESIQINVPDYHLGTRWNELNNKMVPWHCPQCNERSQFVRRGKIRSSNDTIEFYLYRVTCKSCNATFCPFGQMLGLEPRMRITKEFDEKILKLDSKTSYENTSKCINMMLDEKVSSTTIRNKVNTIAKKIKISPLKDIYNTILLDGTKVNASAASRGIDIHLALAPTER